jgi:hypothetical protein
VIAPDLLADFVAGDETAARPDQKSEYPSGLRLQLYRFSVFAQFRACQIQIKAVKSEDFRLGSFRVHGRPLGAGNFYCAIILTTPRGLTHATEKAWAAAQCDPAAFT